MSESTVEKHVTAIYSKLGLSDDKEIDRRVAAVMAFLKEADSTV
jgi:DNA-binding NarL/FixJ family response regulator